MLRHKYAKIVLLLGILAGAVITYFISQDPKPVVIFKGDTTYYIPGKNKRCDWIAYITEDVTNVSGSFSEVHIGVPAAQKGGSIRAVLQIHDDTAMLSYTLSNREQSLPVVMTASLKGVSFPVQDIRFRWLDSTLLTVPLFSSKERCLRRNEKATP
jgi:hypothetical protein